MKPHREVQRLLDTLEEAYRGPAWHGPALRQSLGALAPRDAARRPAGARNSIREIALHAAYWKYAVRRRLTGEKRGSFPLKGSNWFRRAGADARAWREELRLLDAEHRALCRAVAALRPAPARQPLHRRAAYPRRCLPRRLPRRPDPPAQAPAAVITRTADGAAPRK